MNTPEAKPALAASAGSADFDAGITAAAKVVCQWCRAGSEPEFAACTHPDRVGQYIVRHMLNGELERACEAAGILLLRSDAPGNRSFAERYVIGADGSMRVEVPPPNATGSATGAERTGGTNEH